MRVRRLEFPDYVILRSIQYHCYSQVTTREAISKAIAEFNALCSEQEKITPPPNWDYSGALYDMKKRLLSRLNKGEEPELIAYARLLGIVDEKEETAPKGVGILPKKILDDYERPHLDTLCNHSDCISHEGYAPDDCLGELPGVEAACCGHGEQLGYVLFNNGVVVRGYFIVERLRKS